MRARSVRREMAHSLIDYISLNAISCICIHLDSSNSREIRTHLGFPSIDGLYVNLECDHPFTVFNGVHKYSETSFHCLLLCNSFHVCALLKFKPFLFLRDYITVVQCSYKYYRTVQSKLSITLCDFLLFVSKTCDRSEMQIHPSAVPQLSKEHFRLRVDKK